MKTKQILWSVIFLILGIFIGGWGIYSYAQDMIMKNLPIGIASLDEKDSYIESVPTSTLTQRKYSSSSKAKNLILFIGDGMSLSQITAYRLITGGSNSRISVDNFPYSGIVLTHSEDGVVTDSASSATAYSTGYKTNNTYLGLDSPPSGFE